MVKGVKVSLIIPCKNEADSIAKMLLRRPKCIDEVVMVDNNSNDNTADTGRKAGAVVVTDKRKDGRGIGYGFAHRKGMEKARGEVLVTMDGDGTYPLNQVKEVVEYMIDNNLDMVICSRFPLHNQKAISPLRQFGVWMLNVEVKVLYGFPMNDILSGMWVVRKSVVKKLNLKEGGWNLSPEIKLAGLMHPEVALGQYHILHHHRDNGASKQKLFETGWGHMTYIFKRRITKDNSWLIWLRIQVHKISWQRRKVFPYLGV